MVTLTWRPCGGTEIYTVEGAYLHRPAWAGGGVFNQGDWLSAWPMLNPDAVVAFNRPHQDPNLAIPNTHLRIRDIVSVTWREE